MFLSFDKKGAQPLQSCKFSSLLSDQVSRWNHLGLVLAVVGVVGISVPGLQFVLNFGKGCWESGDSRQGPKRTVQVVAVGHESLVGGLEYFCFHILGIAIPTD